jgi:hypothetical protein
MCAAWDEQKPSFVLLLTPVGRPAEHWQHYESVWDSLAEQTAGPFNWHPLCSILALGHDICYY